MKLRIYRTFEWVSAGGKWGGNNFKLAYHDKLQYKHSNGNSPEQWAHVPVIEGPTPEHPEVIKAKRDLEVLEKDVRYRTFIQKIEISLGDGDHNGN